MNEVYTITSDSGDEYKLQFTTDRSGVISDALLDLLAGKGVSETFFFHVIYRKEHEPFADMIADGHQKDFGKPE
jgi:hypothetical protein